MHRLIRNPRGWLPIAAAATALVIAVVVPAAPGRAANVSSGPPEWAYGFSGSSSQSGSNSIVANGSVSGPHNLTFEFTQHATFGWDVLLTQRNLSPTSYELELQRTMGFSYSALMCYPSCSTPVFEGNLSSRGSEIATAFANLTTTGVVWEGSAQVPAVALSDEHALWRGNLTDHATYSFQKMALSLSGSQTLVLTADSHIAVTFTPSLGLVPNNVSTGTSWNASSSFQASGGWNVAGSFTATTANGTQIAHSITSSGAVNGSGKVGLVGHAGGAVRLNDGSNPLVVLLGLTGPFSDREGVILLPAGGDLFQGSQPFTTAHASEQSESTASVDFGGVHGPHLGLEASATSYLAAPVNAGTAVGAGVSAATGPSSPTALFQGQPESVPQAQQQSQCLLGGPCPTVGGGPGTGSVTALLGVGLSVAAAVAVIGLVAARRRPARLPRRLTESPLSPKTSPAPATSASAVPDAPAAEPDPLDRLW